MQEPSSTANAQIEDEDDMVPDEEESHQEFQNIKTQLHQSRGIVNKREGVLSPGRNLSDKGVPKDSLPPGETSSYSIDKPVKKALTKASYLNAPTNTANKNPAPGTGSFN